MKNGCENCYLHAAGRVAARRFKRAFVPAKSKKEACKMRIIAL